MIDNWPPASTVLLICVAGGVGSALRLVLDGLIRELVHDRYPLGTTVINLSGSLLLGLISGLAAQQLMPAQVQLIVGVGLLGGYTTFSTASFETVRLLEQRRWAAAMTHGVGQVIAATALAAVGFGLAAPLLG